MLPSKFGELVGVAESAGIGERPLDFFGAAEGCR